MSDILYFANRIFIHISSSAAIVELQNIYGCALYDEYLVGTALHDMAVVYALTEDDPTTPQSTLVSWFVCLCPIYVLIFLCSVYLSAMLFTLWATMFMLCAFPSRGDALPHSCLAPIVYECSQLHCMYIELSEFCNV